MSRSRPGARPKITLTSDQPMNIRIPDFCLVLLVGASGAGKTTFAQRVFGASEIVGSELDGRGSLNDRVRAQLARMIGERLGQRQLTVVDALNLSSADRGAMLRLAKDHFAEAVAIVLDPDRADCHRNNQARAGVGPDPSVVDKQFELLRRSVDGGHRWNGELAFPLFDQPNLKATFDLSLGLSPGWVAMSNAPEATTINSDLGRIMRFERTDLIPSYLF